jgi:hypothetical protein
MNDIAPYEFWCPQPTCPAEYRAEVRDEPPDVVPRCEFCNTPFLAGENGRYIHYRRVE